MNRDDVSWKKRNTIAGAGRSSLRRLAVGAGENRRSPNLPASHAASGIKSLSPVEADEGRRLSGIELVAVSGRGVQAEGNPRHAPGNKLAVLEATRIAARRALHAWQG